MTTLGRRVFVVDDEWIIATTLTAILNLKGFSAESFTDPESALEAFSRECPDLLISDVMMPGLTGVDLAIEVKALCPKCHILLISGNAATANVLSPALVAGHHFEVLAKPIPPLHLIEVIQHAFQAMA
jgi:CheY-like chemotaxis protein